MKEYYDSPYIKIDYLDGYKVKNKKICVFCGEKMKTDSEWDDYIETKYTFCDCDNTESYVNLKEDISNQEDILSKLNWKLKDFLNQNTKYKHYRGI